MSSTSYTSASLFPTAATGAGTTFSPDTRNIGYQGIKVYTNVTADTTTGTLTVTLQGKDAVSGVYYDILATTAVNVAAGLKVLTVYPALTAAANSVVSDALPQVWRLKMVVATNTVTATVSATPLV
jgi:hypothetical protein